MNKLRYIILMLLLVGCNVDSLSNVESEVDKTITKVNDTSIYEIQNQNKKLISYYLPTNIGILRSNKISTLMLIDGFEVFMTLNISEVISEEFILTNLDKSDYVLVKDFKTLNSKKDSVLNEIVIEDLGDNQFLLYLKSEEVFFLTVVPKAAIPNVLENILLVSRTITINKNAVLADYSNEDQINYKKEVIELFSESVPTEGFIKDIYEDKEEGD